MYTIPISIPEFTILVLHFYYIFYTGIFVIISDYPDYQIRLDFHDRITR